MNIEWKIPDPDRPVRQGDIFIRRTAEQHVAHEVILNITPDPDLADSGTGSGLAALRLLSLNAFIRTRWSQRNLEAYRTEKLREVVLELRKRHSQKHGRESAMREDALLDWAQRLGPTQLSRELAVPRSEEKAFLALLEKYKKLHAFLEKSAAEKNRLKVYAHAQAIYEEESPETFCKRWIQNVTKHTLPDDVFLLQTLPSPLSSSHVVLLQDIVALPLSRVATKTSADCDASTYIRIGALTPAFRAAVLRAFSSAYALPAVAGEECGRDASFAGPEERETDIREIPGPAVPLATLTFDRASLAAVLNGALDVSDFLEDFVLPPNAPGLRSTILGEHGYIFSSGHVPGEGALTISLQQGGPLAPLCASGRHEALGRMLRCALYCFGNTPAALPAGWNPICRGSLMSFQAHGALPGDIASSVAERILLEKSAQHLPLLYAYGFSRAAESMPGPDHTARELCRQAVQGMAQAAAQSEITSCAAEQTVEDARESSLDAWRARLTPRQRSFVEAAHGGSVRLVGPAGSGKTLSLVVKCLKDLRSRLDEGGEQPRFLFLTHASLTASDIERLMFTMEGERALDYLYAPQPPLTITTLYALAGKTLQPAGGSLSPVSLDSYAGRSYQADILNRVLEQYLATDWDAYRSGCSQEFVRRMESGRKSSRRGQCISELLNEFACLLDGRGMYAAAALHQQYLAEPREAWMTQLDSPLERKVVLQLHEMFTRALRDEGSIGCDQMASDFLKYLESFQWELVRSREGYDAVYVDEFHLFTLQARLALSRLLKPLPKNRAPRVFMAYDLQQAPRDSFLGLSGEGSADFWQEARLGAVEKIELQETFRHTPQIGRVLQSFELAFPARWPALGRQPGRVRALEGMDGAVPKVHVLDNFADLHGHVVNTARQLQQKGGENHRVAVLSVSEQLFRDHLRDPELSRLSHVIASRECSSSMPINRTKFIFSMPEFVAGLQFDTVLLIDVNQGEVPEDCTTPSAMRRFAAQVYIGASRAERTLDIYACNEFGGPAALVTAAAQKKQLPAVSTLQ